MPLRLPLLFALLLAAGALVGCDSDDLDDRDDLGARSFTFTLDDRDNGGDFIFDRTFSTSGNEVQYEGAFGDLTSRVVDDGVVLLYASDVVNEDGLRRDGWTALPLTLGFDEPTDDAPNGDGFVDYTLTTTYTFDVGRLFVNLVASDVYTIDFLDEQQGLLADLEDIRFRLVTIPGTSFNRGLDYTDYEAVRRAYDLPE